MTPFASACCSTRSQPSTSSSHARSRSSSGATAPDHIETTGAPSFGGDVDRGAEQIDAPLATVAETSVGKCLRRGSSTNRAPVSTTHDRPNASSSVRSRAARACSRGANGSKWM